MLSVFERLERHYTPEPNTGCWLWTGALTKIRRAKLQYGMIRKGRAGEGHLLAHRVSWEKYRGPIPVGFDVLHHCDNPPCMNPDHLFTGTQADNVADMMAKGRQGDTTKAWRRKHAERRAQTHCKRGHPLSGENLRVGSNGVDRICRACEALRLKKFLERIGGTAEIWRRKKLKGTP